MRELEEYKKWCLMNNLKKTHKGFSRNELLKQTALPVTSHIMKSHLKQYRLVSELRMSSMIAEHNQACSSIKKQQDPGIPLMEYKSTVSLMCYDHAHLFLHCKEDRDHIFVDILLLVPLFYL